MVHGMGQRIRSGVRADPGEVGHFTQHHLAWQVEGIEIHQQCVNTSAGTSPAPLSISPPALQ